jgi:uncharacterized BrkB/YihY/UPF0761 family membrane protein
LIDKGKQKTFWVGLIFSFLSLIIISFAFPRVFRENPADLLNIQIKHENMYYFINLFVCFLLNTILFSSICLFVKEKVQWVLGSLLGSFISAVLFTIIVFFVIIPFLRSLIPSGPI